MSARLRAAVVGAGGFTGKEILRLLSGHPKLEPAVLMSARPEGSVPVEHPGALRELEQNAFDPGLAAGADVVFVCAPHEAAAALVPEVLERVPRVVDLSGAHRLRAPELYREHYGFEHPRPELLEEAVFGLTEWARGDLPGARLVANPGCYATAVLLALLPLQRAGLLDEHAALIADCKSGVSGAGKACRPDTHFAAVHEDFRAYALGNHRHEPEIRQELGGAPLYFTPHLLPLFRGILATIHVRPAPGRTAADLRAALRARYADEPFVEVLDERDRPPCLAEVQGTNRCRIAVFPHRDRAVVVSVLDNLVKGAAGQAIQNANVMLGLPETLGLLGPEHHPRGWR